MCIHGLKAKTCKECRREERRKYYINHKDKVYAANRRWRIKNYEKLKPKMIGYTRAWLKRRKERIDETFGNICNRCSSEVFGRQAAIHKRNGIPHRQIQFMTVVDFEHVLAHPEEWEKLCCACHRKTHPKTKKVRVPFVPLKEFSDPAPIVLGDIRKPNRKGNPHVYHACEKCGKERWVKLLGGKLMYRLCNYCSGGRP